jgi:biopolymer transport protein ExbB
MDIVTQSKILMLTLGAAPVLWLMIGLSLVSITIMVERALYFRGARGDLPWLVAELSTHLEQGDVEGARTALRDQRCVEAEVVRAGLREWQRGPRAVRAALSSALALQKNVLERRLGLLGTLGSNAPFVGLLGTVIGIMLAFEELSLAGQTAQATQGVMSSIAEALVATAIGLCVAIPAVAAFNAFQRQVRSILGNGEALAHLLLVHLDPPLASSSARLMQARSNGLSFDAGE